MNPNRFYIYIHTVRDEFEIDGKVYPVGTVVYVGSGTDRRYLKTENRSKVHKSVRNKLDKKIVVADLTLENKIDVENEWIAKYWDTGYLFNVVRINMPVKDMDCALFNEHFYIDETSPSGLRWKKKVRYDLPAGAVAGRLRSDSDGYWYVKLKQKLYIVQRVIMTMMNGYSVPPDMQVNHIDGNRSNNAVANLEMVTFSENSRRKITKPTNESSGVEHLTWKPIPEYWMIRLQVHGKTYWKVFAIKRFAKANGLSFEDAKEIKKKEALAYLEQLKIEQGY